MPWSVRIYRLQDADKSVRCKASSRITACTVIGSYLVVVQERTGKHIDRACVVKPALESSRWYDDRLIVAEKSNDSTGSHEPTHGQPAYSVHARGPHHPCHRLPACSVHVTGSTKGKSRSTRVKPTRYGAHTNQSKSYPRGVSALHGPRKSSHGLPTCSIHATGLTQVKSGKMSGKESGNQKCIRLNVYGV